MANEVTVQLASRKTPTSHVTANTTTGSIDGITAIVVRVGPLTIRALDRAAVESVADVWRGVSDPVRP